MKFQKAGTKFPISINHQNRNVWKIGIWCLFGICCLGLGISPSSAYADDASASRQFSAQGILTDGTPMSITVVGYGSDEASANSTIASAINRARWLDYHLFSPDGLESKINSLPIGVSLKLPPDVFALIEKAVELSAQSDNWFDVAAPAPRHWFFNRDWRRIVLDKERQTISFKSGDMKLDLRRISKGYLADMTLDELLRAGFSNVMVEVGPVHRNRGHDIFTPWNVQIGFGDSKGGGFAHRVYNYNLTNVATATVTPTGLGRGLIDGRNKRPVDDFPIQSVTIFANDAATATAHALAVYAIGPKRGMQYVDKHPEIKGIMVDNSGQIFTSADLNTSSLKAINRWPTSGGVDGGSNDLRQKRQEEAADQ